MQSESAGWSKYIHIFNGCLNEENFDSVARLFSTEEFSFIHDGKWRKTFKLHDGHCLKGREVFSRPVPGSDLFHFPTGTPFDFIFELLERHRSLIETVVGTRGSSWDIDSLRPYIYPPGAGLSWHTDGVYAGAFIFYAHALWRSDWGGELLIANPGDIVPPIGEGFFVDPRPNRLVVLRGGLRHSLKKVEAAAGENNRLSVTGFFYKASLVTS